MKVSGLVLIAALASNAAASWGFGKSAYNKWHETELERWLSDHNIPYPTPADRKDLEKLVNDNWQTKVVNPYYEWDAPQLQSYLSDTGKQIDEKRKEGKDSLVDSVKSSWQETEKSADDAYTSVKDWIFNSWGESQLKAFLDRHGIPNPNPRTRDTYLSTARENYQTVANKLGETTAYPGNWLYETWTDSDLKKWLDEHGYPAPQPTTRDKLIASVRRNSRLASFSAGNAKQYVQDSIFDTWSDSSLKEFLDKNNVKVPQGSTRNELLALARRNKSYLTGDNISASASSAYKSVTSAGSKATDTASDYTQGAFDSVINTWSDSALKAYLDSRGVPVPQKSKRDELLAKVRLHKHKAATGYGAWTFDTWTTDNLRSWLEDRGQKVSNGASASRDELYVSVVDYYNSASSAASAAPTGAASSVSSGASKATDGAQAAYDSLTSSIAQATGTVKNAAFDTWSDSELKAYLDRYGVHTYQGTSRNELIAMARRNAHAFRYGSSDQGVMGQIYSAFASLQSMLGLGTKNHQNVAQKAGNRAYESAQAAGDTVKEKSQQAYDRVQEEL